MAQQVKSTHRGHCQICGRLQAVQAPKGLLAKHGYTVKGWGYFVGTCTGSDRLPMQKERYYTDQICTALTQYAEEMDRVAEAYRTGAQVPKTAQTRVAGKKDYVHIAWADATELQRRDTVRALVWSCEGEARHARAHVAYMLKLAEQVHGTELLSIKVEKRVAPAAPVVDVQAGTVSGTYATKAARQADLDRLSRQYEKAHKVLQDLYLNGGESIRNDKEATELYYGVYSLTHWRPKHSELAIKLYGDAARAAVEQIEALVKAREAVKNA